MGRRREERAEKTLRFVQSGNETGPRGKTSASTHMCRFVEVCHVCSYCTLIDSRMRSTGACLSIRESSGLHTCARCATVCVHLRVAPCDDLRNSSMLALEAPRRFEAKQV